MFYDFISICRNISKFKNLDSLKPLRTWNGTFCHALSTDNETYCPLRILITIALFYRGKQIKHAFIKADYCYSNSSTRQLP